MGFVIESPELARQIGEVFRTVVPADAYEVRLSEDGRMSWVERRGTESLRHATEPGAGVFRRAGISFLSGLPIEWLL